MVHCKTTAHKKVMYKPLQVPKSMRWTLERPWEAHCDGKGVGYFLKILKWMPDEQRVVIFG
jgi:hypothetical protein